MTLSRFSRVMKGTEAYLDLLVNLMPILKTNEFYILIKHQEYNYRIKAIYDISFNKLKYPKKFRKAIYDAEPEVILESEDEYGRVTQVGPVRMDSNACIFYKVKIYGSGGAISITSAYKTLEQNHYLTNICLDEEFSYNFGYSFYASKYDINDDYIWRYD